MRVLIASDAIAGCDAKGASEAIARAFQSAGADVAVVSFDPELPRPKSLDELSDLLGRASAIDMRSLEVDDFGAEWLFRFGDTAEAAISVLRSKLGPEPLAAIVDYGEAASKLSGIEGTAVARSRAAGEDLAAGLDAENAASAWLQQLAVEDQPGAGAANGLGALLLAIGAKLFDPFEYGEARFGFSSTAAQADLIITGCTDLDFHVKGGELVTRIVDVAESVLRPVVTISGRNFVSGRELRTAGIESAHAVHSDPDPRDVTAEEIETLAIRVARTWML